MTYKKNWFKKIETSEGYDVLCKQKFEDGDYALVFEVPTHLMIISVYINTNSKEALELLYERADAEFFYKTLYHSSAYHSISEIEEDQKLKN